MNSPSGSLSVLSSFSDGWRRINRGAWFLALPIGLAFSLRLWGYDRFVLDQDEIFSYRIAIGTWRALLDNAAADVSHPPLFYLLLKLWISVGGDSLSWMRLLPVMLSTAALAGASAIGRALNLSTRDIFLALTLLAVNSYLIYYAQHLRSYALLQLVSAVSIWRYFRLLNESGKSEKHAAILTIANIALAYTHYFGWILIAAQGALTLIFARRLLIAFLMSTLVVLAVFSPWIYSVGLVVMTKGGDATGQIAWLPMPLVSDAVWLIASLHGPFAFPRSTLLSIALFGMPVIFWCFDAFAGRQADKASDRRTIVVLATFAAAIPMTAYLVSLLSPQVIWHSRHFSQVAIPYLILVAASIWRLKWPKLRVAMTLAVIIWASLSTVLYTRAYGSKIPFDTLVTYMRAHTSSTGDDIVVVGDEHLTIPLAFYADRLSGPRIVGVSGADVAALDREDFWVTYSRSRLPPRSANRDEILEAILQSPDVTLSDQFSVNTRTLDVVVVHVTRP